VNSGCVTQLVGVSLSQCVLLTATLNTLGNISKKHPCTALTKSCTEAIICALQIGTYAAVEKGMDTKVSFGMMLALKL